MKSFNDYKGTLPYASELFGIYQPLLGWKSRLTKKRYEGYRARLYSTLGARALVSARSTVQIALPSRDQVLTRPETFEVKNLVPVNLMADHESRVDSTIDSGVARLTAQAIGSRPPSDWGQAITQDRMQSRLVELQKLLSSSTGLAKHPELQRYVEGFRAAAGDVPATSLLQALFERETKVAGYLVFLAQHTPKMLDDLFFQTPRFALSQIAQLEDPLLSFGANSYEAVLSPIGVIHLYREYFFEFDSFLGPPVGHVWLSPGGTVELIEVNTRKVFTEQTFETSTETITKASSETTQQDDIADAVKEENRNDIKFGFTNTASYSTPVFSDTATGSFSLDSAKSTSRERTHKQMRQQSEKLSSEIKRNFKTTFRTSTEVTDTTSKRYVIQNTTDELVNYELRRKMRKVGVQVQDIGVQLCWHTFVDDAGRDVGVGKLVHIGEPPSLADLLQPDQPEMPAAKTQDVNITIPFVGIDTDDTDNAYTDGTETEVGFLDSTEHIEPNFPQSVTFTSPGYTLKRVDPDPQGSDAKLSIRDLSSVDGTSSGSFTVHLDYVHWHDQPSINIKLTLVWEPSEAARAQITVEYDKRVKDYNVEKARRYKEAFYKAARERIALASKIVSRPGEDLREEERTVVYRRLISQLMSVGTHESKHVVSELVRSLFDVDKMLYFVAPEWWAPRLHRSVQHLGEEPAPATPTGAGTAGGAAVATAIGTLGFAAVTEKSPGVVTAIGHAKGGTPITAENVVDWGGARELGRDNYYITEDSAPAKLGSSLGWLLQLDGDNLRNTFLNSPWVKAVIPIRLGKEREALNWLQQAHVEGSDGLDSQYVAAPTDPPELQSTPAHTVTVREALTYLATKIREYDRNSRTPVIANPADPEDISNHFAGSLPTEAVFEHGFYPLKGGVRFDQQGTEQVVFSQWMEILPTDQVAAMQIEYDPKTLQVKVDDDDEDDPNG
ncbi:MAG TPA: hypothetical protein VI485_15275 [Vicinamibacterales bacterium]|nr:hypothetical protein [Vicinamibacterales bacterium]